jgi:hypothetical protein
MKYIEYDTGYTGALDALLSSGGQMFSGDSKDGCHVVNRGSICSTFWEPFSAKKGKVTEACLTFGYDPYAMTGGRLCRKIIDDIIELPYKNTYYSNTYRDLAKDGYHWHYQHCELGSQGYVVEVDLDAAYMTQFLRLPSMILKDVNDFASDNGSMERLRDIMPLFPKWLRVQFLGVLASHSRQTLTRVMNGDSYEVKRSICSSITYGASFNAAHRAILRVYKIMKHIHELAGEYCVRIHTDSFCLRSNTPKDILISIAEFLQKVEQPSNVKAYGKSYFFDLNSGIIGKKLIGSKLQVSQELKEVGYKQSREDTDLDLDNSWGHIIDRIKEGMREREKIPVSYEQAIIKWTDTNEYF